jgi:hypothetical protein
MHLISVKRTSDNDKDRLAASLRHYHGWLIQDSPYDEGQLIYITLEDSAQYEIRVDEGVLPDNVREALVAYLSYESVISRLVSYCHVIAKTGVADLRMVNVSDYIERQVEAINFNPGTETKTWKHYEKSILPLRKISEGLYAVNEIERGDVEWYDVRRLRVVMNVLVSNYKTVEYSGSSPLYSRILDKALRAWSWVDVTPGVDKFECVLPSKYTEKQLDALLLSKTNFIVEFSDGVFLWSDQLNGRQYTSTPTSYKITGLVDVVKTYCKMYDVVVVRIRTVNAERKLDRLSARYRDYYGGIGIASVRPLQEAISSSLPYLDDENILIVQNFGANILAKRYNAFLPNPSLDYLIELSKLLYTINTQQISASAVRYLAAVYDYVEEETLKHLQSRLL